MDILTWKYVKDKLNILNNILKYYFLFISVTQVIKHFLHTILIGLVGVLEALIRITTWTLDFNFLCQI